MYSGKAAIDFLITQVNQNDPGQSSHWQKYHSSFQFKGDGFSGLRGFGECIKPRGNLLRAFEMVLQSTFRNMADDKQDFSFLDKIAARIVSIQNRNYNLDILRQVLTLSFLRAQIPELQKGDKVVCVIGDGFATMTSLLLASNSSSRVVLVNLTKTLLVDLWYLNQWMGDELFGITVDLVTSKEDLQCALDKPITNTSDFGHVIAIRAADHELIRYGPLNLVINIASMQEMNPIVISSYFDDMRECISDNALYFYCSNRLEKFLPGGEVTRFFEYPWSVEDQILVDELTPWHQRYYSFMPPFFRLYDGPSQHRLAVISKLI